MNFFPPRKELLLLLLLFVACKRRLKEWNKTYIFTLSLSECVPPSPFFVVVVPPLLSNNRSSCASHLLFSSRSVDGMILFFLNKNAFCHCTAIAYFRIGANVREKGLSVKCDACFLCMKFCGRRMKMKGRLFNCLFDEVMCGCCNRRGEQPDRPKNYFFSCSLLQFYMQQRYSHRDARVLLSQRDFLYIYLEMVHYISRPAKPHENRGQERRQGEILIFYHLMHFKMFIWMKSWYCVDVCKIHTNCVFTHISIQGWWFRM